MQKMILSHTLQVFCTSVSENTVKHTHQATFWSERVFFVFGGWGPLEVSTFRLQYVLNAIFDANFTQALVCNM